MYLLDTSVLSEARKVRAGRADPQVMRWVEAADPLHQFLSVITVQELEMGTLRIERRDPVQGRVLRMWLEDRVLPTFAGRLLPVDLAVARRSAALQVPDPRPERDSLIAATALVHGMTVVTRNVADFALMGVPLLNPWNS